mmetsp:Transcript_50145/g.119374  ORF Transcript_50145/g.119374 Transcript_50145/m.119374 type:complete len:589 (+) Transcript_50145:56-1822(+)
MLRRQSDAPTYKVPGSELGDFPADLHPSGSQVLAELHYGRPRRPQSAPLLARPLPHDSLRETEFSLSRRVREHGADLFDQGQSLRSGVPLDVLVVNPPSERWDTRPSTPQYLGRSHGELTPEPYGKPAMPPVVEDMQCCFPARPSSAPAGRRADLGWLGRRPATAASEDNWWKATMRREKLLAELQDALAKHEISEGDVRDVLAVPAVPTAAVASSQVRPCSARSVGEGSQRASTANVLAGQEEVFNLTQLDVRPPSTPAKSNGSSQSMRLSAELLDKLARSTGSHAEQQLEFPSKGCAASVYSDGTTMVPGQQNGCEAQVDVCSQSGLSRSSKPSCKSFGASWSSSSVASASPFAKHFHGMLPANGHHQMSVPGSLQQSTSGISPSLLDAPDATQVRFRKFSRASGNLSRPATASRLQHVSEETQLSNRPWSASSLGGESLAPQRVRRPSSAASLTVPNLSRHRGSADEIGRGQGFSSSPSRIAQPLSVDRRAGSLRRPEGSFRLPDAVRKRVHALALQASCPGGLRPATPASELGGAMAQETSTSSWLGRGLAVYGREPVFKMSMPVTGNRPAASCPTTGPFSAPR